MRKALAPFPYYGGKGRLLPFILPHLPGGKRFVDLFGGSGAVSFGALSKYWWVVYNDVEDRLVNFFRVLRENPDTLIEQVELTPLARAEFEACREKSDDPIEDARRTFVLISQSFANQGLRPSTSWSAPNSSWYSSNIAAPRRRASSLPAIAEVLRQFTIENSDWRRLIRLGQSPETTLFADPPYDLSARAGVGYNHEMTEDDHRDLARELQSSPADAVVCGYRSDLYDEIYADWRRVDYDVVTMTTGRKRTESLWIKERVR